MPLKYTHVNLGVVGLALLTRAESLYPVAFANSAAILASFWTGLWLDPTAKQRMMERFRMSSAKFDEMDFSMHVVPFLVMAAVARPGKKPRFPVGLASLALNLAWAAYVRKPGTAWGDLSHVYVKMTPGQWRVIWAVAFASHLAAVPALRAVRASVPRSVRALITA